ncbi:alpha/beta-hydrolase [Amylocystis lapponica]|nr:alpha/beta-hydrolase [Amylocystis lapponica]
MSTIWFPAPVVLLFRRLVNVVSSVSISHQYLLQRAQTEAEAAGGDDQDTRAPAGLWDVFRALQWPAWIGVDSRLWRLSLAEGLGSDGDSLPSPEPERPPRYEDVYPSRANQDTIHRLLNSPVLYDPIRKPRYPIALCHGLYGFDVRGPSAFPLLQTHYWSNVLNILRQKVGAEVIVTSVPSTGSIASRAESMDRILREKAYGRGINFIAHSMGGLDCRHLITHIKPSEYEPLSLTSIATPHHGSPFMDWCNENIGLGKIRHEQAISAARDAQKLGQLASEGRSDAHPDTTDAKPPPSSKSPLSLASLPSSFTTLLLSLLDSPAYANLTSTYLTSVFNPSTPDDPSVKYFSVAARLANMSVWHPLWLPKMVLDGFEERERARLGGGAGEWGNDGLVTVQSARWGEFLGILEGCDHWDVRGARGIEVELPSVSVPGLGIALGAARQKREREPTEEGRADGWNVADWSRFVRAWKSEEKKVAKAAGAGISKQKQSEMQPTTMGPGASAAEKEQADEVVKSSTDKLSAVVDWIVDQVPSRNSNPPPSVAPDRERIDLRGNKSERKTSRKQEERSDLATKMDLERFYVALCKKLYDEGL